MKNQCLRISCEDIEKKTDEQGYYLKRGVYQFQVIKFRYIRILKVIGKVKL